MSVRHHCEWGFAGSLTEKTWISTDLRIMGAIVVMPVRRTDFCLRHYVILLLSAILLLAFSGCGEQQATETAALVVSGESGAAADRRDPFRIDEAQWKREESLLRVKGKGNKGASVAISNADTLILLGQVRVDDEWEFRNSDLGAVPCRVRAEQSDGQIAEMAVKDAPEDCAGGIAGGQPGVASGFALLGANDLGMRCADLDYQIFSILPPFNVVHAQAIEKGTSNSLPRILDGTEVAVTYHAASSADDPAGAGSINTTSQNSPVAFKSNFWEDSGHPVPLSGSAGNNSWGGLAYGPLYPSVLAGALVPPPAGPLNLAGECSVPATPAGCPSILNLFEPLPADTGIPVPDPNALSPVAGSPELVTAQQHMPGPANIPQEFDRFDRDLAFFVDFPFGSRVTNVNWFAADGVPIMPVDDDGRGNAYPLMQLTARDKGTHDEMASLDVVLPVASEADCQNCHVEPIDCADPSLPGEVLANSDACIGAAVSQTTFQVETLDDNPPGKYATRAVAEYRQGQRSSVARHEARGQVSQLGRWKQSCCQGMRFRCRSPGPGLPGQPDADPVFTLPLHPGA